MQVNIVVRGLQGTDVRERIAEIARNRLEHCWERIAAIRIWASDENGPKVGGKRCRIEAVTRDRQRYHVSKTGERLPVVLADVLDSLLGVLRRGHKGRGRRGRAQ